MKNKTVRISREELIKAMFEEISNADNETLAFLSNELFPGTTCEEVDNSISKEDYIACNELNIEESGKLVVFDVIFPNRDNYKFKYAYKKFSFCSTCENKGEDVFACECGKIYCERCKLFHKEC